MAEAKPNQTQQKRLVHRQWIFFWIFLFTWAADISLYLFYYHTSIYFVSLILCLIQKSSLLSQWLFLTILFLKWTEPIMRWSVLTEILFDWGVFRAYNIATAQVCEVGVAKYLHTEKAHSNAPMDWLNYITSITEQAFSIQRCILMRS